MKSLTKKEAIEAMRKGEKVSHPYFGNDEYITIEGGRIFTEDGYPISIHEFFQYRIGEGWETNWYIK